VATISHIEECTQLQIIDISETRTYWVAPRPPPIDLQRPSHHNGDKKGPEKLEPDQELHAKAKDSAATKVGGLLVVSVWFACELFFVML
jgi:hypothetical protein